MKVWIKNGRLIDPINKLDGDFDLLLDKGKVSAVAPKGKLPAPQTKGAQEIDAQGLIVSPGFIDMHVHFREPGFEYKETIQTGCESAAAGGFTSVAVMPNTDPVIDNRSVAELIQARAREIDTVNVFVIGAISQGLKGEKLTDMGELKDCGVVGFSDDGHPVMSNELMRRALEYSRMFDLPCIQHSEVLDLTEGGCMNEGLVSTELGLKGMPTEAEDIMVFRDIALLKKTGGRLHVAHISSGGSVELVRQAKSKGLPVTCEVAPHHFALTDEAVRGYDTNSKMSPPLRTQSDIEDIKAGLKDGTIDMIATDHAPHDLVDKQVEFDHACFGIVGLETALPLSLALVDEGILTMSSLIEKMSSEPARIFKIDRGNLAEGKIADISIYHPDIKYKIDVNNFKSRSKNSPFHDWKVRGKVIHTIVSGKIVYTAPPLDGRVA
jgi:dihydroorotase